MKKSIQKFFFFRSKKKFFVIFNKCLFIIDTIRIAFLTL
ncbi:hypothetical protein RV14_GL001050 [Enterococcus ratti]|uniref:Uncharacterized protein n=1 Tax=Enterococcus ratti TaxID=150033 RepID=A0A1L8WDW5_9ENTE|nr:hypothetical protein RV14_GL001050 [Enterococcus ratti]